jgi:hypothetical protein
MEQAKSLQKAIANTIGPKSKKDAEDPNQSSLGDLKTSLRDIQRCPSGKEGGPRGQGHSR